MAMKLRELIRAVRAAKTGGEERAVITKECALIRTAFKDQHQMNGTMRHRNVAKLLFIHMLGYPSHFGQMETLKLISAGNFAGKRIGYLALMVLLDEMSEVLTLVTNSLKNDLRHENQFVVGLALTAAGNIGSPEMMRNLAPEIDKHLRNQNPFIRKKTALCALRVVQKVPELAEDFGERIVLLLNDRNHAVFLNGVHMVMYLLQNASLHEPQVAEQFKTLSLVKKMVKRLVGLVRSGYQPEYDVSGITDPFLQVAILRLLRLLGEGSAERSEVMSDILAQVATNTETNKNTGNAILYECVLTIMNIESESGLRVLAINLLGRFLLNNDNNIRYVALNTLCQVVEKDITAVSRHRNTIVDCLKDPDITIRRRAMELIYSLVNDSNVRPLAREMLNYLVVADAEFKADLCSRIADVVRKFAPSARWHIDTMLAMLSIAGQHVQERLTSQIIQLIARNPKLHPYVVHKLFSMLQDDLAQEALARVGTWSIGELGEYLLQPAPETGKVVTEKQVVDIVERSMKAYFSTDKMKAMALTALAKLSVRCQSSAAQGRIAVLIGCYKKSMRLELQQRSTEYAMLLDEQWTDLRPELLKAMPVAAEEEEEAGEGRGEANGLEVDAEVSSDEEIGNPMGGGDEVDDDGGGDDLLSDLFDSGSGGAAAAPASPSPAAADDGGDLLSDLFSTDPAPAQQQQQSGGQPDSSGGGGDSGLMGDMGGMGDLFSQEPAPPAGYPSIVPFTADGITLTLSFKKTADPSVTEVTFSSVNNGPTDVSEYVVQAATPSYIALKWRSTSGNHLPANGGGSVTQGLMLRNQMYGKKKVLMKLKILYNATGSPVSKLVSIGNFPEGMSFAQ